MGKYDDIINLPHPVSKTHAPMPRAQRAAQFSPFAALTGYDDAVRETARLTETRVELDRDALDALDRTLHALEERIAADKVRPEAQIRYFVPDERKAGGRYVILRGAVKKIDEYSGVLLLTDGKKIPLGDILSIEPI